MGLDCSIDSQRDLPPNLALAFRIEPKVSVPVFDQRL